MKNFFAFIVSFCAVTIAYSQSVAINTDGSLPHPSAMLDVKNPNKGILIYLI